MDRIKTILALAPFVAIAIAITFLQGYWGTFGILAFPYLSLQELIAYSAAPLFGFIIFVIFGISLGVISAIESESKINQRSSKNKWLQRVEDISLLLIVIIVIVYDRPEKWLLVPFMIMLKLLPITLDLQFIKRGIQANAALTLSAVVMVFLLICSLGYGRMNAEKLIRLAEPNASITFESKTESGKFIGKLGGYYFLLATAGRVHIYPENEIKKIEYLETIKHKSLMNYFSN